MTTRNRRLLIGLYLLSAALVFLYIGFPSEALRAHVTNSLSAGLPGLSVAIGDMRPALPAGIVLKGVRVSHANAPLAVIDQLRIRRTCYPCGRQRPATTSTGASAKAISPVPPRSTPPVAENGSALNARLAGVLLQKMPATQSLFGNSSPGAWTAPSVSMMRAH